MTPAYEIVPFDGEHLPPVRDLATLHAELLPTSPVALLGPEFMQQFYYRILPRERLISGAVAYVDRQPAGFIVATQDSAGFMRSALRRHWLYLSWVLALSVLRQPIKRLGAIWEALQIMRHQPAEAGVMSAELLSFGVLPEYRSPRFIRQTKLQVSKELFDAAVNQLKAEGVSRIRAIVDADNTPAKLFYHSLGWYVERSNVPGWRTPSVEFVQKL
jgi:ribosomal protein S18 acetylase RimI-like enzyme